MAPITIIAISISMLSGLKIRIPVVSASPIIQYKAVIEKDVQYRIALITKAITINAVKKFMIRK